MIDLATVVSTAGVTGLVQAAIWATIHRQIARRDARYDKLVEEVTHLKEQRVCKIEDALERSIESRARMHKQLDAQEREVVRLNTVLQNVHESIPGYQEAVRNLAVVATKVEHALERVDEINASQQETVKDVAALRERIKDLQS